MARVTQAQGGNRATARAKSKEIRDHRDLRVWRKARKLAELCESAVSRFGREGDLAGAISRLANQVPEEIQAGQAERTTILYLDHLARSRDALHRLERRLMDAYTIGVLAASQGDPPLARSAEINRMPGKLVVSLEEAQARRRMKKGLDSADVR